jgi:hypothetical protein
MGALRTFGLWLLLAAVPATASAVTVDQIVQLKKAGVTDAVILALIERDHTVFSLQPEQIVALQKDGLSEAIIIAMLKSGEAGEEAARADSAYATSMVAAAMAPGPEVLIVGHGPERPNTYHYDGFFTNSNNPYLFPLYRGSLFSSYGAPYEPSVAGVAPFVPLWRGARGGFDKAQPRALCYAQVNSSASRSSSLNFVTECPRVLQPSRRLR